KHGSAVPPDTPHRRASECDQVAACARHVGGIGARRCDVYGCFGGARCRSVGWVERSETHRLFARREMMGFAAVYPSYARPRFRSPHERSDMRGLLRMVPDVASLIRATAPMFSPDPVEAVPDRRE